MKFLLKRNYLERIRRSVGSKLFQTLWVEENGKEKDVAQGGLLSCALFVSNLLKTLDLIGKGHATVDGTVTDMKNSGWFEIEELKEGAVLVWESIEFDDGPHKHIGFYVGNEQAVSNGRKTRTPIVHSYLYNGERKVERVFWHPSLDK